MGWGGLFDYSVKPGPDLSRSRLGLVRLVTRSAKVRFGQVCDQVGQSQGWELVNKRNQLKICSLRSYIYSDI